MKYLLPALFLLLAPLTGCDPSDDFDYFALSITDIVVDANDLSTLEAAVIEAGLDDDLASGEFTVFAPTDAAFAALLADLGITAEELLARDDLGDILGLHVIPGGTFEADDLTDGATFTTLSGGTLTVFRSDDDRVGIDSNGDGTVDATVTTADIDATNGVVHKIDAVLSAPVATGPGTVTDLVVAAPDLSTLEAAVIEAGLDDDLAGAGPFTVFAPTDAAFTAYLEANDLTAAELLASDDLESILLFHVVSGSELLAADFTDGAELTTLSGGTLTAVVSGGTVGLDTDGDGTADATVTTADIDASNGVVHKIDAVLVEPAPSITQIVVDAEDLTTLEAAVIEAGLDGTLAGDGTFTVFAPTDAAFAQLLDDLDITAAELLAREDLAAILQLHVLGSVIVSGDLADGATVTTLNGQTLTVVALEGGGFGLDTEDEDDEANATITTADITASNGVVHKIDAVLIPADS